jgi:hypothetical protein
MMGYKVKRFETHIAICLEDLVPQNSFYRHVEAKLDLSFVRNLVSAREDGCQSLNGQCSLRRRWLNARS